MENPIKMDDLGVPLFLETPIYDRETVQLFHNQQMSICTNQKPPLGASKLPILNQPALQKLETTYIIYIYIYEALSKFLAGLLVWKSRASFWVGAPLFYVVWGPGPDLST